MQLKKISWLRQIFMPSYWLYMLFCVLTWILSRLSYQSLVRLGQGVGWLAYHFAYKPRGTVLTNLKLCFPQQSVPWRAQICRHYFMNLGIGAMEFIMALWWSDKRCEALFKVSGLEHLDAAVAANRGVILLAGHFTCLEILIRLASLRDYPWQGVYRDLNSSWLNQLVYGHRARTARQMIERKQTRKLLRALQQGALMFYLPDMDMGKRFETVFAPFFGIPAATITATSRLAQTSGALVMPVAYHRLADNKGYEMKIMPALEHFPSGDVVADATRVNACLQELISQQPAQYFWHHKRFRRRPDGEAKLYA